MGSIIVRAHPEWIPSVLDVIGFACLLIMRVEVSQKQYDRLLNILHLSKIFPQEYILYNGAYNSIELVVYSDNTLETFLDQEIGL